MSDVDSLIAAAKEDELVLRRVVVAPEEIVMLKSVIEAYPGLGIVVAPRASGGRVTVIGARGCERDIDDILTELGARILGGEP